MNVNMVINRVLWGWFLFLTLMVSMELGYSASKILFLQPISERLGLISVLAIRLIIFIIGLFLLYIFFRPYSKNLIINDNPGSNLFSNETNQFTKEKRWLFTIKIILTGLTIGFGLYGAMIALMIMMNQLTNS
ncbi:MAG TPA: hypothetical protein PLL95_04340 [Anaerolineales bacterium]|nr:hypothetical protein [Anaerolineales bacterium]